MNAAHYIRSSDSFFEMLITIQVAVSLFVAAAVLSLCSFTIDAEIVNGDFKCLF